MKHFNLFHKIIGLFNPRYAKKVRKLGIYRNTLQGKKGIEIGGPSKIFTDRGNLPVYNILDSLDGCNYSAVTVWNSEMKEGAGQYRYDRDRTGNQYISEASDLKAIENAKYDFLLSSHCLEHCANPIRTLLEWKRVVKQDGHLVIVLPHKNGTFDHRRPVTLLDHMIADFKSDTKEDDLAHLGEIMELHDFSMDKASGTEEDFKARSLKNLENRCLHHHVFDGRNAAALIDYAGFQILDVEVRRPYHIIVFVQSVSQRPSNSLFLNKSYYQAISPFGN